MQRKTIMFVLFLGLLFSRATAQEAVVSGGGYAVAETTSISWTLGELAIETFVAGDLILTQGFQQGSLLITTVEEITDPDFRLTIYPNPVSDHLIIEVPENQVEGLRFQVFDLSGRLLMTEPLGAPLRELSFGAMEPGMYMVRFIQGGETKKTVRIIKK